MANTMQKAAVSQSLVDRIKNSNKLPTLPQAGLQLLELLQDEDTTVAKIAAVVGHDPVISARVLKVANSSMFGLSQRITSLQQAIVALGMRSMKTLAMALSVVNSFDQYRLSWFDYQAFWRRSVTQAVAARLLAKRVIPGSSDEAFVAGLLSDLGVLVMAQTLRTEYARPYRHAAGDHGALLEMEQAFLGTDHIEVAYALFGKWNLRDDLRLAVRMHHQGSRPGLDAEVASFVDVVHMATCIADLFCDGACNEMFEAICRKMDSSLSIGQNQMEAILRELDRHVKESAGLMSVDIGRTANFDTVQKQAAAQVALPAVHTGTSRRRQATDDPQQMSDLISGLPARPALEGYLNRALRQAIVSSRPLGLVLCEIESFAGFSATYGQTVADMVIASAGDILHQFGDRGFFVARYGPGAFALAVPNCGQQLVCLAMNICQRFRQASIVCSKGTIEYGISAGAASTDSLDQPTVAALVAAAEHQLSQAMQHGRFQVRVAPQSANHRAIAATDPDVQDKDCIIGGQQARGTE